MDEPCVDIPLLEIKRFEKEVIRGTRVLLDELASYDAKKERPVHVVATFETEEFAWAGTTVKVEVVRHAIRGKDPRNPNPKAGARQVFAVVVDGVWSRPISNRAVAENKAKNLFDKIVAKLRAENTKPESWGAF